MIAVWDSEKGREESGRGNYRGGEISNNSLINLGYLIKF